MVPDAVIFDLDGLLVDSEPLWVQVECELFSELGAVLSPQDCASTTGLRIDEWVAYWYQRRQLKPSPQELETMLIDRMAVAIETDAISLPGAQHAIDTARGIGVPVGLASSAPDRLIQASLRRLELGEAFDVIVSAEHEPAGKPNPAVYLSAAQQLSANAARCVAIEDSPAGVRAALNAGMRCIAVPASVHHCEISDLADLVLSSLCDLVPGHLEVAP